MVENIARNIGYAFFCLGGIALFSVTVAFMVRFVLEIWFLVSTKFRAVWKVESLIFEYNKNRENFLEWREKEKKKEDYNGKA